MSARTTLTVLLALALFAAPASARIWQVNNKPGVAADFTTLQAAHDSSAVESGDTLYVSGSAAPYGDLTATKELHVFGPGYFLEENGANQASPLSATIGNVVLDPGSEGSLVTGVDLQSVTVSAGHVDLLRSKVREPLEVSQDIRHVRIGQSHIGSSIGVGSGCSDILIHNNCFLYGPTWGGNVLSMSTSASAEVTHNVFAGGNYDFLLYNSTVTNNIVTFASSISGSGNTYSYNMSATDLFGTVDGNVANANIATVFVGSAEGSTDGQWQLRDDSPAIGAGFNGVDMGAFGGAAPYVLSGIPPIPTIYSMASPAIATTSGGLAVSVSVRSRN